jgi:hypothetical protein
MGMNTQANGQSTRPADKNRRADKSNPLIVIPMIDFKAKDRSEEVFWRISVEVSIGILPY